MPNVWLLIDRIKEKLLSIYRKKVFLARIKSGNRNVNVLGNVYVRATNIKIGNNVTIYPGVSFSGCGEIVIGDNVDIGQDTMIYAQRGLVIGNNVAIAAQCYIIDCNHGVEKGTLIRNQPLDIAEDGIRIGNDVWISAGCKVLKGAQIHDGAVIGAMSLVNSEIPENAIAHGIPTKVKKFREYKYQ